MTKQKPPDMKSKRNLLQRLPDFRISTIPFPSSRLSTWSSRTPAHYLSSSSVLPPPGPLDVFPARPATPSTAPPPYQIGQS
uniref:Uncharacterized protein n=1 Tax=Arundo donax TaxID=35708 RepID=A0A0A8ZEB7_ARUDO